MPENLHENCGVAAVYIPQGSKYAGKAAQFLYKLLLNLQGRGQLSAGITTYNPKRARLLETYKDIGLVSEVFKEKDEEAKDKIFASLEGNKGIGHTRYATSGTDDKCNAQPSERMHGSKWKWFAFCFNGNIANYADLKQTLVDKTDYHIMYDIDTELIMHNISKELYKNKAKKTTEIFSSLVKKFDGAFNIAFLNAHGTLSVFRDPIGFRPLCYGYFEDVLLIVRL